MAIFKSFIPPVADVTKPIILPIADIKLPNAIKTGPKTVPINVTVPINFCVPSSRLLNLLNKFLRNSLIDSIAGNNASNKTAPVSKMFF